MKEFKEDGLYENEYYLMEIKNGILIGQYKENLKISLEIAKKCVDYRLSITKGYVFPSLITIGKLKDVDRNARDYFFNGPGMEGLSAIAIVANDFITRVIAKAVLAYSSPKKPIKIFENKENAVMWLEKFKK